MNQNCGPVKARVEIHERERAKITPMRTGRGSDEAVIWYCHMRLVKRIAEGAKQNALAEEGEIPPSAVNQLLKKGVGVGPTTAAGFAKIFGFGTRGQLTDAADRWWATSEAREHARRAMREMARARELKMLEEPDDRSPGKNSSPKSA